MTFEGGLKTSGSRMHVKKDGVYPGERVNRTGLRSSVFPCVRPRDRSYTGAHAARDTKLIVSMRGNKTRARHYRPSFGHWERVKA